MVEYCCCPSPQQNPDIVMNETTKRYRTVLKCLVYGEFGVMIAQTYIFGLFTGLLHVFHIWINYAAYATMNPCTVIVVGFCAGLELLILFMNANEGSTETDAIFESPISQALFYTMFVYGFVKLITAFKIYQEFRKASLGYPPEGQQDDNFRAFDVYDRE